MKKFLLLALAALFIGCQSQQDEVADVIYINGDIYTVNTEQPRAEAIAVKGERILAVGENGEIEKYKGENTEVIDLDGKFAMPGFIEGHGHFSGLGDAQVQLDVLNVRNWNEIVRMVAAAVDADDLVAEGEGLEGAAETILLVEGDEGGGDLHRWAGRTGAAGPTPFYPALRRSCPGFLGSGPGGVDVPCVRQSLD